VKDGSNGIGLSSFARTLESKAHGHKPPPWSVPDKQPDWCERSILTAGIHGGLRGSCVLFRSGQALVEPGPLHASDLNCPCSSPLVTSFGREKARLHSDWPAQKCI